MTICHYCNYEAPYELPVRENPETGSDIFCCNGQRFWRTAEGKLRIGWRQTDCLDRAREAGYTEIVSKGSIDVGRLPLAPPQKLD